MYIEGFLDAATADSDIYHLAIIIVIGLVITEIWMNVGAHVSKQLSIGSPIAMRTPRLCTSEITPLTSLFSLKSK